MFFIGISDVRADNDLGTNSLPLNNGPQYCYCYYYGEYNDGNRVTYYDVTMKYDFYNRKELINLCESDERKSAYSTGKCETVGSPKIGEPCDIDAKYIFSNNCSIEACNSAKISFYSNVYSIEHIIHPSKEIVTSGYNCDHGCVVASLQAYSKEQHNSVINSDNMLDTLIEQGVTTDPFKANIDSIICWGKNGKWLNNQCVDGDTEVASLNAENIDCEALLSNYKEEQSVRNFLNNLFWIISIIGIILLIIMTSIEFIKVVTGQDDEGLIKAFKHTVIRGVCVVILLLLPIILSAILGLMNDITDSEAYYLKDENDEIVYRTNEKGEKEPVKLIHIGATGDPLCGIGNEKGSEE
ncbi:MAG: hypothetical protein HFH46_03300 [Bacilli bacterium]|nr:hypothetical protein [Bacilli bacterium]